MFSFSLVLQNGTSPGILDKDDKTRSLLACFWKTAFPQAYLTKHVLFLYFTRQTWQRMFSFGLFLHNGISPGILDKNDKACSLSASFCKTAFHQAYLTKFDKACSLSACFLQNGISPGIRQSMFSFSLVLQNGTSPGILDKDDKTRSLLACFWKTAFPQAYLTKHVLFQLAFCKTAFHQAYDKACSLSVFFQNGISLGLLDKNDKACTLSAWFCKTAFHQAYLTKHILFQLIFKNGISPGIVGKNRFSFSLLLQRLLCFE